jgi:TonB family protein
MELVKGAAAAFALWFSLAPMAFAQGAPVADNVAGGRSCMAVNPTYPSAGTTKEGTTNKVEDTVLLNVRISKSGVVHDVKVASGPPTLTAAALKAVKRSRYEPAYWVTGPPSERQTFLAVTLVKGSAPKVKEVALGVPSCIPIPQRVRVSQAVMGNRLLSRVEADYPPEAQTEHIVGVVVVRVVIDKSGGVLKADSVSGPSVLVPAAIEAVKQWKYQPYLLNGEPFEVETTAEISFTP